MPPSRRHTKGHTSLRDARCSKVAEVEVNHVIVLLVASALAAAGVVGTILTVHTDGFRQIPTEVRF